MQCRRQSLSRQRWCSQQRLRRRRCRRSRRSRSRWHRHPASTRGGSQHHDSSHCSKQRTEHGVLRPARRPAMWSSMRDHGAGLEPDRLEKVLNQKMCEWGFDIAPRERREGGEPQRSGGAENAPGMLRRRLKSSSALSCRGRACRGDAYSHLGLLEDHRVQCSIATAVAGPSRSALASSQGHERFGQSIE